MKHFSQYPAVKYISVYIMLDEADATGYATSFCALSVRTVRDLKPHLFILDH